MISIFPLRTFHISTAPAYGIEISQRMQYSGVCGSYHDFLDKGFAVNKEATKPRVHSGNVEVITSKVLRPPP
jgi:hypothetical protein